MWKGRGYSPLGDSRTYKSGSDQPPDLVPPAVMPPAGAGNPDHLLQEHPHQVAGINFVAEPMRYGDFTNLPLSIGLASGVVLQRPSTRRIFLAILNSHATQSLYVAFGTPSSPALGLELKPGGVLFLDTVVPQNDVNIVGSGANTTGALVYCNKDLGQN